LKPVEWPTGDGIHTTVSRSRRRKSFSARTPLFVVCSLWMIPFGVASVPELKINSEYPVAAGTGADGRLVAVGELDRDDIAGHESLSLEAGGQRVRVGPEFADGDTAVAVAVDNRERVGRSVGTGCERHPQGGVVPAWAPVGHRPCQRGGRRSRNACSPSVASTDEVA
jgi:hypothetical protein